MLFVTLFQHLLLLLLFKNLIGSTKAFSSHQIKAGLEFIPMTPTYQAK